MVRWRIAVIRELGQEGALSPGSVAGPRVYESGDWIWEKSSDSVCGFFVCLIK